MSWIIASEYDPDEYMQHLDRPPTEDDILRFMADKDLEDDYSILVFRQVAVYHAERTFTLNRASRATANELAMDLERLS